LIQLNPASTRQELSTSIKILILMTILSLAPSFVVMMTSFTRIMIVLGFLRQAMGTQHAPSGQILSGLAIFMTIFIMAPVWQQINTKAIQPYVNEQISEEAAWQDAITPLRAFMLRQTGSKELGMFIEMSGSPAPQRPEDVDLIALIPAFMTSELKTAFQLGFLIYLPFLVVDLVVSASLMSLGMMMLPPMMISLPIKILFFILADGWTLLLKNLVISFKM
jgi:flagellar biosynthetic protein FliP